MGGHDSEVTRTAAVHLTTELRALYRHAPIDADDLLTLAPTVSRTLHRVDHEQALLRLWDVFDSFTDDREVDAAKAMLGLSNASAYVFAREMDARDKHNVTSGRTIRRWSYRGIDKVVARLLDDYDIAVAHCHIKLALRGSEVVAYIDFTSNVDMDQASVWLNDEPHIRNIEPGHEPWCVRLAPLSDAGKYGASITVMWTGQVDPHFVVDFAVARRGVVSTWRDMALVELSSASEA